MNPDDPRHGTNAGHRAHFSADTAPCQPCRDAHAAYRRNLWRKKYTRRVDTLHVPTVGVIRRIRALQAIGWRLADIDTAMGYDARSNFVHNLTRQAQVHRDTFDKVQAAYDQLCMTPGPSERTRRLALRRGWAPPLAWDDIDDDAAPQGAGRSTTWTRADLVDEWDHLRRVGVPLEQAAIRLGVTPSAITKAIERTRKDVA